MAFDFMNGVSKRIEAIPRTHINEFGVDPFGFDPNSFKMAAPLAVWLYRKYFRCEVHGLENIPDGRMIVISNHSGQLPFDGMMLETAFLLDAKTPRVLRGMAERWSADLPFISRIFARGGTVVGEPSACRQLLNMGEAVLVFPEGVKGIIKKFRERYQLLKFGHGFMRLALQTRSPIVPVAVIGAEEQLPSIANITALAKLFRAPAFPLILPHFLPIPLPVKYRIYIGEPMNFGGDGTEDAEVVADYVRQTRDRVQTMLNEGCAKRKSIFF